MSTKPPSGPPASGTPSPKIRRAQLALGFIVLLVLALNFALFLIVSERDTPKRTGDAPITTNAAEAPLP
ncbi:MAG: hypothetical protein IPM17_12330 [Verrucomicrobia bacterium]|nr:hypothetical protein [Verrucomicrobiota bacterium]